MKRPHNNVSVTSAKKMEGKQVPAQRINGPAMAIYEIYVTDKSFEARVKALEEDLKNQLRDRLKWELKMFGYEY